MKYVYRHGRLIPKDNVRYVGQTRGPYVISDEMPPTEQVDGVYYTSKARFRAKGRELGLVEVGNERFPVKHRDERAEKASRIQAIKRALAHAQQE